jgi:hypothetical protein
MLVTRSPVRLWTHNFLYLPPRFEGEGVRMCTFRADHRPSRTGSCSAASAECPDYADQIYPLGQAQNAQPQYFRQLRRDRRQHAAIGIVKGQPFSPDERIRGILDQAARSAPDGTRYRLQSPGICRCRSTAPGRTPSSGQLRVPACGRSVPRRLCPVPYLCTSTICPL